MCRHLLVGCTLHRPHAILLLDDWLEHYIIMLLRTAATSHCCSKQLPIFIIIASQAIKFSSLLLTVKISIFSKIKSKKYYYFLLILLYSQHAHFDLFSSFFSNPPTSYRNHTILLERGKLLLLLLFLPKREKLLFLLLFLPSSGGKERSIV
jgi:hypothetical protein